MFLTKCHTCGQRELRGLRSVDLFVTPDHRGELVFRCSKCAALNSLTGDHDPVATAGGESVGASVASPTPAAAPTAA